MLTHNQSVSLWKSIQDYLGGVFDDESCQTLTGPLHCKKNALQLAFCWTLTLALWFDMFAEDFQRQFSIRSLWSWVKNVLPSYSFQGAMGKLASATLAIREMDNIKDYRGFKHLCEFGFQFCPDEPLFDLVRPAIKACCCDHKRFWQVNTALTFIQRMSLPVTQIDSEIDDWEEEEERLENFSFDPIAVKAVRSILQGVVPVPSRPIHSAGATAELKRGNLPASKYRSMRLTAGTYQFLRDLDRSPVGWLPIDDVIASKDCPCKLTDVPKKALQRRLIINEPIGNQYAQHALGTAVAAILDDPKWGVRLRDQGRNQRLCYLASEYRDYATIDLSSASDTISLKLLKEILEPAFYGQVVRTRSPYCLVPKRHGREPYVKKLCKAFGMGNASAFNIESIVFSACLRAAGENGKRWGVYGDDIICSAENYQTTLEILRGLGFRVNADKSYAPTDAFKESCGVEYFNGVDVSPIRIPRRLSYTSFTSRKAGEAVAALGTVTRLANKFYASGLRCARAYLLQAYMQSGVTPLFGLWPDEGVCWSDNPTNFGLDHRYNRYLQRYEVYYPFFPNVRKYGWDPEYSFYSHLEALEDRLESQESFHVPAEVFLDEPSPVYRGEIISKPFSTSKFCKKGVTGRWIRDPLN